MIIIDGKKTAADLRLNLKNEVDNLKKKFNKVPGLTVILIGECAPSKIYVRNKEKLLLTDPDMSSDGIACAISLIFGFDGELYRQVYYRRINECVGLFQMRWPGIRDKARRAATKGNPISNRGSIYKPDPDLVPNNDITHKAFGNVAPRKRAAKGSSSGSRKGSSSKSSGTSNRQRII